LNKKLTESSTFWAYGGDFNGDFPTDYQFCCNGLIWPDRTPHPAMAECKYLHQSIAFTWEDAICRDGFDGNLIVRSTYGSCAFFARTFFCHSYCGVDGDGDTGVQMFPPPSFIDECLFSQIICRWKPFHFTGLYRLMVLP
jgi:hypothetical protein